MSRRLPHEWLRTVASRVRIAVVVFVAVLASGLVHAHEREEDACEEADDCSEGECPEPVCGPSHHCGCCSPLVVTCTAAVGVVPPSVHAIARVHRGTANARTGVRSRVERPPRVG